MITAARPGEIRSLGALGIDVRGGPVLLADLGRGPTLAAHRDGHGARPNLSLATLIELVEGATLQGRGGAGFPFGTKLRAVAAGRRPPVVVNFSEGEPASAKDAALALLVPHLVLDGALAAADALGSRVVHVVVPEDRPAVGRALEQALAERRGLEGRVRLELHHARASFVSGQARAVIELLEGRENKPVTSWQPEAISGLRGRPTLLSNAETFAHVGALVLHGASDLGLTDEPGTTLLTVHTGDGRPEVLEVELGTPWRDVLGQAVNTRAILVGGYHGCWAPPGALASMSVSRRELADAGLTLGAGLVLASPECPVLTTARITSYLATQSAGRCGPCVNGLPTLAALVSALADGTGDRAELDRISALVKGRGACAHPDGTVRLVRSMLAGYEHEVVRHARGACGYRAWRRE